MLEILAPGGSVEGLHAAVAAGADAVYMGGRLFGARAYADNPGQQELLQALDYCHLHDRKLYLTVNTLLKEEEYAGQLYDFLLPVYEHGLDAVLVQDMGVLSLIRREFPDLPVHASTQMSVQSPEGAAWLKEIGVTRIVPARELSLEEIRDMYAATQMEIECFVHGAFCYCYSGRCLLSSLIGGRSGNRGRCAQPCRQAYELIGANGQKTGRAKARYLMSMKDLCAVSLLPELIDAGVCSFKIEGRMKRPEYAAFVVSVYRRALDRILSSPGKAGTEPLVTPEEMKDLMDLYNRGGFCGGYYIARSGPVMMSMDRPNHAGTFAARALAPKGRGNGKNTTRFTALENLYQDDLLEIVSADRTRGGKAFEMRMSADCPEGGSFTLPVFVPEGERIRRVQSPHLIDTIQRTIIQTKPQKKINGIFILQEGKPAILTVQCGRIHVSVKGIVPQTASGSALTEESVRKQLMKTGNTPFVFDQLDIDLQRGLFLPLSVCNQMRRDALERLEEKILLTYRRSRSCLSDPVLQKENAASAEGAGALVWSVYVRTPGQARTVLEFDQVKEIILDSLMWMNAPDLSSELKQLAITIRAAGRRCLLAMPPVWRIDAREAFFRAFDPDTLSLFDGYLLRCQDQLGAFRAGGSLGACRDGRVLAADTDLYTANSGARLFLSRMGLDRLTLSVELNAREAAAAAAPGTQLVVYGYLPAMISTQCLKKNTGSCNHVPEVLTLRDRMKEQFPVLTHCSICVNEILNSHALCLVREPDLPVGKVSSLRLNFTVEPPSRVREVLAYTFSRTKDSALSGREAFTKGHWKRGVE